MLYRQWVLTVPRRLRYRLAQQPEVGYRLKRPIGETEELLLAPRDLLARLVTLVPPPRAHLTRYHGVFAPNAQLRPQGVLLPAPGPDALVDAPGPKTRLDWAGLLRRVWAVEVLKCPRCPEQMRVLAYLNERAVVRRILGHLGLPAEPPAPFGRLGAGSGAPPGRLVVDVAEAEAIEVVVDARAARTRTARR